ncbi:MAG: hypothetical protein H8E81_02340 [Deltaproteobacteria bacterium]|nr:hypothetical protein [Deltaproteobacteria bacterium]
MPKPIKPMDLKKLKTYPLAKRKSKVSLTDFAKPWHKGNGFKEFLSGLPDILGGSHVRSVISAIVNAHRENRAVVFAMGAHVIKVGLNPIVIDLMERGIISAVAMNGAGIIHDAELAMAGKTSEDVSTSLGDGSFGMAEETAEFLSTAIKNAEAESMGLGDAVGRLVIDRELPHQETSILAAGVRLNLPVTVHLAFGTDILHMHPDFDPKAAGAATHRDFRIFASVVSTLEQGVYLNVGSAVILPEVFLKALTLARNLAGPLEAFTAVNIDFIRHYRPLTNVVQRPTASGGLGIDLAGHHEILIPLIAAGIIEQLDA